MCHSYKKTHTHKFGAQEGIGVDDDPMLQVKRVPVDEKFEDENPHVHKVLGEQDLKVRSQLCSIKTGHRTPSVTVLAVQEPRTNERDSLIGSHTNGPTVRRT